MTDSVDAIGPLPTEARDPKDDTVGLLPSEMTINDGEDQESSNQKRRRGADEDDDDTVGPLPSEMEDSTTASSEPPKKKPKKRSESVTAFNSEWLNIFATLK